MLKIQIILTNFLKMELLNLKKGIEEGFNYIPDQKITKKEYVSNIIIEEKTINLKNLKR